MGVSSETVIAMEIVNLLNFALRWLNFSQFSAQTHKGGARTEDVKGGVDIFNDTRNSKTTRLLCQNYRTYH